MTNNNRPRLLIEDWLPVTELSIESRRERAAASALPPLSFLHVWWARRPLVASAAVVLAGLLPAWTPELAAAFPDAPEVQTERAYHRWLLHLVGIWGDPVAAKRSRDAATATGRRSAANPFTYKQAFRNNVSRAEIDLLHVVLRHTWGEGELPLVADPTAGGGSIPFTATRLGLPAYANDLNGVAASVLQAGVATPTARGTKLVPHLEKWGGELVHRMESRLKPYFPCGTGESVTNYIWANAVDCPRTGRLVPLMPDKWLRNEKGKEAAVRMITEFDGVELTEPMFEVVTGRAVDTKDASTGTIGRGDAVSPYDNLVIDGEYIKKEAQAGRMRHVLYAVVIRTASGAREFRGPTAADLHAIKAADDRFDEVRSDWTSEGVLPTEDFPDGNDMRPKHYGMDQWVDFFTPRQALVHGTFGQEFAKIADEVRANLGDEIATDVLMELALMQGKALNYNSRLASWHVPKQVTRSVFDRHDFAFKWTFSEFEGATGLYGWCLSQLVDAYRGIAQLVENTGAPDLDHSDRLARPVMVTQGSAANLSALKDGSVTHLCMDPPYHDNLMYAELADYFYVWEKRTLGRLLPDFFVDELTDKENEAVANVARFEDMGKRKRELADLDYEAKMTSIFAECRRVLRDDGVMSVMFTHKRAEAWDTLGMSLLNAGFTIETSWPVHTEPEKSTHQANKNSAASTIMLVCRKRPSHTGAKVFFEDIEADVRQAARDAVTRFEKFGIDGVDLMLSTYGPALSVISQNWPVYSSVADEDGRSRLLRPDEALDIARAEVVRLRRKRIVGRDILIDDHTDFAVIAWATFKAAEFPFDDARRLALTCGGLDVDALVKAKVLEKKSGTVRLLPPKERVRRGGDDGSTGVRVDAARFVYMNDAVDTVLHVAEVDGMPAAKTFMDRLHLTEDQRFLAAVQGLVNAIPRKKVKGEWVIPHAGLLDTLVTAHLQSVDLPLDPIAQVEQVQDSLWQE